MHETSFIQEIVILIGAAVIAVPICQKLRVGSVLGYLFAGLVVGPFGLTLVSDVGAIKAIGELGIVFLLFVIGLELPIERLKRIGLATYGLGSLQILVTLGAIGLVAWLLDFNIVAAVVIGGALALSSTAIVIETLRSRQQTRSAMGRVAIAILLLQDLAVSPLLVVIEVTGKSVSQSLDANLAAELGLAAVKGMIAIGIIMIVGRLLLRPLLRIVAGARSPELFVASVLLVALGTSYFTEQAGLSLAFGAFLAGMLLAETEYRHQVAADIEPFRGILLGLFFMTVGMSIDMLFALNHILVIIGLVIAIMVGKGSLIFALGRLFGIEKWRSIRLGAHLCQGGEFGFVLFALAADNGILTREASLTLVVAVAISMALTPLILSQGLRWLEQMESRGATDSEALAAEAEGVANHTIIVGYGEVGGIVARLLKARELPYLVLDMSPRVIKEARSQGEPVFYGDATIGSVLEAAQAGNAHAVVISTRTPQVAISVLRAVKEHFPDLPVFARGGNEATVSELRKAGITDAIPETLDSGLRLVGAVLDEIDRRDS
ncbi:MAG: monovalent cation:proton antiporter-2 (CPA2) family protein [Rhodospirillales bacterium]